jgi:diguanylate cyclase (GGDEF)-like protein
MNPPKTRNGESDPLRTRFGLARTALKPAVAAAFDELLRENDDLKAKLAEAVALADHDTLTRALTRRAFMRALHQTMSFAERYKSSAAVLYVDLDGFKAINDSYGHAAGDAVLRHVAQVLRAHVRESDIVGRIGGDEFGVILQHSSLEGALSKAESLTTAIEGAPAMHCGVAHRLGASIGVHAIVAIEDPETALSRADEAMYAAKHARKRETFTANGEAPGA